MSYKEGDVVFFFHPKHSWIVGSITGLSKTGYSCRADDPVRKVSGDSIDKVKEDHVTTCRDDLLDEQVDDLLQLTVLHDATLLRCLYLRYMSDVIYTNIGAIVVAFNPFNFKIPRYMDDMMEGYLEEGERIEKNVPHSWAQAHNTYNEMMMDKGDQCILISGESGAGKTEATKIVMKYLANIAARRGTSEEKAAGMAVGARLTQCSPILESFGNAKTVRNNNSSRFGKFMKVKFTPTGQLVGAHTTKYLLEKSRIITASKGERIYHAFYLVVRGGKTLGLRVNNDKDYKSLSSGQTLNNPEFDTEEEFTDVANAMKGIDMTDSQIKSVWAATAGIVSVLNVTFSGEDGEDTKCDQDTVPALQAAINLWKIDAGTLLRELTTTTFEIKGVATTKKLTPTQAIDGRDAVCKALYDGMFSWLVEKCNETCDVPDTGGNWIGLLDIFGFEDFEYNSFEQICINLANETLQNHYNTYIFSKDMEECRAEGIDVTEVKCPDNKPCLNLVSGKMGVMDMLDEECAIGERGTDLGFLDKVDEKHAKNPFYEKKKTAKSSFIVKHYAGNVTYEVPGWLEKNRDTLKDDMRKMINNSEDDLIKTFVAPPLTQEQKKGRALTVGGFFKTQVQALMEVINSTNPHWIRCIKPHPAKKPLMFDGVTTMNQLESSGVLGTVKIRKAGYPIRIDFERFAKRYLIMANAGAGSDGSGGASSPKGAKPGKDKPKDAPSTDFKTLSSRVLAYAGVDSKELAQVGKSKVFLKSDAYPILERKRGELLMKYIFKLQAWGKGTLTRMSLNKPYWEMKWGQSASVVQKEYRDYVGRSAELRRERARLKKEMEERMAALVASLAREEEVARDQIWEESGPTEYDLWRAQLDALIDVERERLEMTKAERVELEEEEYRVRTALFNEGVQEASEFSRLRMTEIMVWAEIELYNMGTTEEVAREELIAVQHERVDTLSRQIALMNCDIKLQQVEASEATVRQTLAQIQNVNFDETKKRLRLILRERLVRAEVRSLATQNFAELGRQQTQKAKLIRRRERQLADLHEMRHQELDRITYGVPHRHTDPNALDADGFLRDEEAVVPPAYIRKVYAAEARRMENLWVQQYGDRQTLPQNTRVSWGSSGYAQAGGPSAGTPSRLLHPSDVQYSSPGVAHYPTYVDSGRPAQMTPDRTVDYRGRPSSVSPSTSTPPLVGGGVQQVSASQYQADLRYSLPRSPLTATAAPSQPCADGVNAAQFHRHVDVVGSHSIGASQPTLSTAPQQAVSPQPALGSTIVRRTVWR